jgi:hypothetical protein
MLGTAKRDLAFEQISNSQALIAVFTTHPVVDFLPNITAD